ncbi:terpene synthase family protein [Streptomyces sp. NPDC002851]
MTTVQSIRPDIVGEQHYLPDVLHTLPTACHPWCPQLMQASDAWTGRWLTRHFGNPDDPRRFASYLCAWWTAMVYPHADPVRLREAADMTQCLTSIDDVFALTAARDPRQETAGLGRDFAAATAAADVFLQVFRTGDAADHGALAGMLADVWGRIRRTMPPAMTERYLQVVETYQHHMVTELANNTSAYLPGYEEYLRIRRETVVARPFAVLTEYTLGVDLPQALTSDTRYDALIDAVCDHLSLVNDLYSYRKETIGGDWMNNAITVLRHGRGMDLQTAVDTVCRHAREAETRFIALRDDLARTWAHRPDATAYLNELGYLITGSVTFERGSPRYHGPGFTWNGDTEAHITFHLDHTEFTPTTPQQKQHP